MADAESNSNPEDSAAGQSQADSTFATDQRSAPQQPPSPSESILVPHNSLRNIYNPRTLLVVASDGCLRIPNDLKILTAGDNGVLVRVAKKLPLDPTTNRDAQPIDAIALVCKVNDKESLENIESSIAYIDPKFFVGKCFVLAIIESSARGRYEIKDFASEHGIPIHYASRTKRGKSSVLRIAPNLVSVYCPPPGSTVNNLLIETSLMNRLNQVPLITPVNSSSSE